MRHLKILLMVLLIALSFNANLMAEEKAGEGPRLVIENSTNEIYIIMLYWIDHPFLKQTFGRPFNIVGAELAAGELFNGSYQMAVGKFYIDVWERDIPGVPNNTVRRYFKTKPKDKKLTIIISKGKGCKHPTITVIKDGTSRL